MARSLKKPGPMTLVLAVLLLGRQAQLGMAGTPRASRPIEDFLLPLLARPRPAPERW